MAVAKKIYGAKYVDRAGRIDELMRDINGGLTGYHTDDLIIIPDWRRNIDESYYEYYFHLIRYPINECEGNSGFMTPCWYIAMGEPYNNLLEKVSTMINMTCFLSANRTYYDVHVEDIVTKPEREEGIVFVFPICP